MSRLTHPIIGVIFSVFFLFSFHGLQAQKTVVFGKVTDAETGHVLPFVNISFKGSKVGTTTNLEGEYKLETYYPTDSLQASFVGFSTQTTFIQKDRSQEVNFKMKSSNVKLHEVVITGDKKDKSNPALDLLEKVIENKEANNREKLEAYEYEVYNKIEFDVNNIPEELRKKKVMQPFAFVFENMDTSASKPYIPMFMTETVSDFYYRKNPKSTTEVIKGSKVSGLQNESISQFLGDMYQNVNIYENFIGAFRKSFVSPLANMGTLSYNYYLVDSGIREGVWCYKLNFFPKRKGELTFQGNIWIADTSYAVKEVDVTISKGANINFIEDIQIKQTYSQVEREVWMLTKDHLLIDFQVSEKTMGFYGRKTTTYTGFVINQPRSKEFYSEAEDILVKEDANELSEEEWNKLRHDPLSDQELKIYNMVDSLKNVPQFNTYLDVITLLVSGYWVTGDVEIGPYFTFYSFNPVEGNRLKFGMRTSNDFSTRVMPEFYVAYGTRDKEFKYGFGAQYFPTKSPRRKIGAYFKHDVEQLGMSQNAWRNDNILASLFRRNPANQLNGFREYDIYYEREWFQGFLTRVNFTHRYLWSVTDDLVFEELSPDGNLVPSRNINFSDISLYARFAYQEKYVNGEFERISLGTKYPTLQAKFTYGLKGVFDSRFEYQKLILSVSDKIRFGYFGYTDLMVEAGKIWGTAPFPILELHNGNETFFYDPYAFNLMNFYEFVSDQWASLSVTHHFNGLFLNKVPLLRKLQLREVATFKMVAGSLRSENQMVMEFPNGLQPLGVPYSEGGVGIENILTFFRVDALWRFAYLNNPNISKFGLRATVQLDF